MIIYAPKTHWNVIKQVYFVMLQKRIIMGFYPFCFWPYEKVCKTNQEDLNNVRMLLEYTTIKIKERTFQRKKME